MENILKKFNFITCLLLILVVVLFIALIGKKPKLSSVEEIFINNESDKLSVYYNLIDENSGLDEKIAYALTYSANELNDNSMTIGELVKFINNKFDVKISNKDIEKLGVSPYMIENQIIFNLEKNEYELHIDGLTLSDIAAIKLYKYNKGDIKKVKDDVYEITYTKYEIDNPYSVLNYYLTKNAEISVPTPMEEVTTKKGKKTKKTTTITTTTKAIKKMDTTDLDNYLKGKGNRKSIEKYLTNDVIKNVAKKGKSIKVKYVVKDNEFKISNIKSVKK